MSKLYILLVTTIIVVSGCNTNSTQNKINQKPVVVATTSIVADIAINLCSDFADVTSLMGPGVDPHLYKASHGDIESLTNADVIIYSGLHLEGKMSEILEKLKLSKTVINVSDGVDHRQLRTINASANVHDPHIWFDLAMWSDGVKHVSKELIRKFPEHKLSIEAKSTGYLHAIDSVHQVCLDIVERLPVDQRILITSHDAFEYFGRSYNFKVRGLQGISTLSESGLKDVTDMVNFIIDNKIKAVFVENSVPQKALRSVIDGCKSKGHDVVVGGELFSDALGADRTPEGTYLGMVHFNVETVINGLK
jgi:manganese/zinc/iron transport system substrate-binding protein